MTAWVDRSLCCGSGSCEAMGPGLFRLTEDGYGEFVATEADAEDLPLLDEIAGCCPTGAITVRREEK